VDVGDGAWCWFGEPRALTTQDVTIFGWVSRNGDIQVASLNNQTRQLVTRTLHARLQRDDHANPAFFVRQDGRIMAFYSRHAGSPLYYRTTTVPARISAWGPEQTIPTNTPGGYGYTYPSPVWSPLESKLYLFWRGGNFLPTFSTSEDEGATWAPAKTLMDDNEPHSSQRPYVKYAMRNGVIHVAYNQAHPRDRATSVFYIKYTPGRGWQRANGAGIGEPPFIPTDGDRVYNAWEYAMRSWVHDIAVDANGHPRIVFATFSRSANYTDHRYWYARWDGQQWHKQEIVKAGPSIDPDGEIMYSAGIILDHENPDNLALARRIGQWFQIEAWQTRDQGRTWKATSITNNNDDHMRPVIPRDHSAPGTMRVLFFHGRYNSFTTYETTIAAADHQLSA
jgi:BNR repeat-containing family member